MARESATPPAPTGPFLVAFSVTCTYRVPVGRIGAHEAIGLAREMFEITHPEHRRAWLTGGGVAHDFRVLDCEGRAVVS